MSAMSGESYGDRLPSLQIPCSPVVRYQATGLMPLPNNAAGVPRSGTMSLSSTPEVPPRTASTQLPNLHFKRGIHRYYGYQNKTLAYGAPEVVKKIFTGQLPHTYFNDICYGKRSTPGEFMYTGPKYERVKDLWEPKNVSREQARHVIRDIQDARFRKQNLLEKQSARKERQRVKRTEIALLKEAEMIPRGLQAYLTKLNKQKEKYDAKLKSRRGNRRKQEPITIDTSPSQCSEY